MLLTPHVLLGLYFIRYYQPSIALPAAFISHFLFDFFYPHWNPHIYTQMEKNGKINNPSLLVIFFDLLSASFSVLLFLLFTPYFSGKTIFTITTAIFSILPDLIEIPYYFLGSKNRWLHSYITFGHKHQAQTGTCLGIMSQTILAILCIWQLI